MDKQVEGGSEILCSGQMIGSLTWLLLMASWTPWIYVSVFSKMRRDNTQFTDENEFWVDVLLDVQLPQTGSVVSVRLFQVTVDSVAESRLNKVYSSLWKLIKLLQFSHRCRLLQAHFGITALWFRDAIVSPPVLFIHLRCQFSSDSAPGWKGKTKV